LAAAVAPVAAFSLAAVELISCFDNAVVAGGNRIGLGAHLYRLNRMRFFLHAVFIALLLPVYAGIGQGLGISAFDAPAFTALIALATAGIAVFGYFAGYRALTLLIPTDYFGCLRYAQSVTAASRIDGYDYSAEELASKAVLPMASILTVLVGLALSIWIGVAAGFWVPAIVTGLMLLAGSFPSSAAGALATSGLEIVFSAGLVFSLVTVLAP
jgi:hypothetical protein